MSYILQDYDDALSYILKNGVRKKNRTGVDTLNVLATMQRYRIDDKFPILTKRKVWPKSIFAELLWILSGSTNNNDLQALGSNIWTPWTNKEFENKNGYVDGSLGPIYGFQLRYFGGFYGDGDKSKPYYGCGGFDQLQNMLRMLKVEPTSRRNIFSLWNPKNLHLMRLPPCHYTFQVSVYENMLSGVLTQRSCDFPIGVPANIQFYSALIYMLAQQTGLKPYEFVHNCIESHIYVNQIEAVEEYLSRERVDSPVLELGCANSIDSYSMDSFMLKDYSPLNPIKIPVAV